MDEEVRVLEILNSSGEVLQHTIDTIESGFRGSSISSIFVAIIAPIGALLVLSLRKFLVRNVKWFLDFVYFNTERMFRLGLVTSIVARSYAKIELAKPDTNILQVPSVVTISLQTDNIFVPLTMEEVGHQRQYSHTTVLEAGNRIRIIGDPGAGKTSIVKRLFRDACHRLIDDSGKHLLPIIVELRNLSKPPKTEDGNKLGDWLFKEIKAKVCRVGVFRVDEYFDLAAKNTGLMLLLDGLDEVATTDYPRVEAAILKLSDNLSNLSINNVIVLTMRIQFHQQVGYAYSAAFPASLAVQPFTPSHLFEFLDRWPFASDRRTHVARLYGELTDRPSLREMCSNPLILAMYVAHDQAQGGSRTPDSRTEFYRRVTEELVKFRRARGSKANRVPARRASDWMRFLGRIALDHLTCNDQAANHLEWSSMLSTAKEVFRLDENKAEDEIYRISSDTGLISMEREHESWRFIHLTFCEFLAAYAAVDGAADGWNKLLKAYQLQRSSEYPSIRTRLAEVVPFAAGLLPTHQRQDALNQLCAFNDQHLTALTFLETKLYEHNQWDIYFNATRDEFLASVEQIDQAWLKRLHLFTVVVEDAIASLRDTPSSNARREFEVFYRDIISKRHGDVLSLIASYAKQDAAAALHVAELCHIDLLTQSPEVIVDNCDQPAFRAMVCARLEEDGERVKEWVCVLAEAALQSEVVAMALKEESGLENLRIASNSIPKKDRSHLELVGTGPLIDIVNVAYFAYRNNEITKRLNLLSELTKFSFKKITNERRLFVVGSFVLIPCVAGLGLVYSVIFDLFVSVSDLKEYLVSILVGVEGGLFYLLLRWVTFRGSLREVIGLRRVIREQFKIQNFDYLNPREIIFQIISTSVSPLLLTNPIFSELLERHVGTGDLLKSIRLSRQQRGAG